MERGYIKIWRKLEESGLLQMPNTLALFMFLLLHATHKTIKVGTKTGVIELQRGQYISGIRKLSDDLEQSYQVIRTGLERLEKMEIITIRSTTKYSVYTIDNYDIYQDNNTPVTHQQQTDNKQITHKQELNKKPNTYSTEFLAFWEVYPKCKRKGGRPSAYKVWQKLNLDGMHETVIAHLKQVYLNTDPDYICAPDVHLNKQGWDGFEGVAKNRTRELAI